MDSFVNFVLPLNFIHILSLMFHKIRLIIQQISLFKIENNHISWTINNELLLSTLDPTC